MKVLKRILKEGKIELKVESLDDLWHLYNIVAPNDVIVSRTIRRVKVGDEDDRKQESVRKPMTLVLRVEDAAFHTFTNRVRIKGTILEGPSELVSIGSHHTFNIEMGDTLTIIKEHWPDYLLKRIDEAEKKQANPVCIVVSIEDGAADLILVADYGIREAVSVRSSISRKRGDQKTHDATMREFYVEVATALQSQLEQNQIGLVIVAGPGFVKDHFKEYISTSGMKNLPPLVLESTNSIGIPAAKEILYKGVISTSMAELKIETETRLVEDLIAHLAKGDGLAAYGEAEVARAAQYGAIESLLITDKRLREGTEQQRRWTDNLIHDSEKTRAVFHIVSTDHPAGDQLQHLGGIAAILRFVIDRS